MVSLALNPLSYPIIGVIILLIIRIFATSYAGNSVKFIAISAVFGSLIASLADHSLLSSSFQIVYTEFAFSSDYFYNDKLSSILVVLTTFITLTCLLGSLKNVIAQKTNFYVLFLFLEVILIVFFKTKNIFVFYTCFELSLVPLFFLIGIYGGNERIKAAYKFFLYTFLGSLIFLAGIVFIYSHATELSISMSSDIGAIGSAIEKCNLQQNKILWLALFLAFAIKMPMWPFHTWLPYAHVEAPTSASMMLAGVILKMAGYAIIRITLQWFPELSYDFFAPYIYFLSVIAAVYISLVALVQKDMKKMIAYSSVAHMAVVTAGLFTQNTYGLEGAVLQMVSHGIVSASLFMMIGILYDRTHTKYIADFSGIASKAPLFACSFLVLSFASIGLPGTSGFVAEFLVILGLVNEYKFIPALGLGFGIILSSAYMLLLCKRVLFGLPNALVTEEVNEIDTREKILILLFIGLTIYIGLQPNVVLEGLQNIAYAR